MPDKVRPFLRDEKDASANKNRETRDRESPGGVL
jgi:hypothetical protein